MKGRAPEFKTIPIDVVGSSTFGRYPKISVSQTFNMIISDDWLVDYAGFRFVTVINSLGKGRGIYASTILKKIIAVVGSDVFVLSSNLVPIQVGTLTTSSGDVFIDEDTQGNIAICDKVNIYYYTPDGPTQLPPVPIFTIIVAASSAFTPGYVAFHNTRFVSVDLLHSQWRLSDPLAKNRSWPFDAQHVGAFQTKGDKPLAAFPFPGRQNLLVVSGSIVTQIWNDAGLPLFPYQLQTGFNIDYGAANADTFSNLDNIVCWLGINDKAGPVILASLGESVQKISTDGIDFKLASLSKPQDSHAFMFKQDGHIILQMTFPTDNFSLIYDFNTQKFFTVTDTYGNYHPAKNLVFFNNTYYFVSLNDGNLYEMSTNFTTYAGNQIPRIRVCSTIRMPNNSGFVANNITFPLEQGVDSTAFNPEYYSPQVLITQDSNIITTENAIQLTTESGLFHYQQINGALPAVDLSISNDGGYTFGNFSRMILNPQGNRKNRFIYYNLGWSNEITPQFRFWSNGRFVVGNGTMDIYQ